MMLMRSKVTGRSYEFSPSRMRASEMIRANRSAMAASLMGPLLPIAAVRVKGRPAREHADLYNAPRVGFFFIRWY